MLPFSNPRLVAEFNDWPIGGNHRGQCKFVVELGNKRGIRISRTTTDKNGAWCKPKFTTYGGPAVIVDGSDGKTYILQAVPIYNGIHVIRHDFMDACLPGGRPQYSTVYKDSKEEEERELYETFKTLIMSVK
jgi:hypothetical protein